VELDFFRDIAPGPKNLSKYVNIKSKRERWTDNYMEFITQSGRSNELRRQTDSFLEENEYFMIFSKPRSRLSEWYSWPKQVPFQLSVPNVHGKVLHVKAS
jgi:thiamine biosynthesis lipoprotein ApbE